MNTGSNEAVAGKRAEPSKRLQRVARVRAHNFSISLDGYGAGPDQSMAEPLGRGGGELHEWFVETRTFKQMHGAEGGTTGPGDIIASRIRENVGAWIMGRNMFGPPPNGNGEGWGGWWGENPPFHAPVFVLTHRPGPPLEMEGGTRYEFIADGIADACERAIDAAAGKDVIVLGGVSVIRQFLEAKLLDELHVAIAPILLGGGEALFAGLDLPRLGYRITEHVPTNAATHMVISTRRVPVTSIRHDE